MQAIQPALHTYLLPSSLPSRITTSPLPSSHSISSIGFPERFLFFFIYCSISLFIFSIQFFSLSRLPIFAIYCFLVWFLFLPFIMIKKAISPLCQPSYLSMYVSLLQSLSFLLQLSHSSFLSFIPLLLFLFFYTKPAFLLCSLSLFLFSFFPFYLCRFQYLSLAHSSLSFFHRPIPLQIINANTISASLMGLVFCCITGTVY